MTQDKIDRNDSKFIYQQICDIILNKIKNREYKKGKLIPSERELSNELEVSRYTIRKAIEELVHQGYLYRVQGTGTFVYDTQGEKDNKDNKSKQIGVIMPYTDGVNIEILNGIESALDGSEYTFILKDHFNNYKKEAEVIQFMKRQMVDGLIINPAEDQKDSTAIYDLKSEKFPFVLVDRKLQFCHTSCVMADNINGSYKATEYLIQLGHENIMFLKGHYSNTSTIEDRITGYKRALREYGIKENDVFTYDEQQTRDKINEQIFNHIEKNNITGVIGVNDIIVIDLIKMSREYQIDIPEELSVVSFDYTDKIKHLETKLTTVNQHSDIIGQKSVNLLLEYIEGNNKEKEIQQIYQSCDLEIRDSCRPID